jgi:hypothetical protein
LVNAVVEELSFFEEVSFFEFATSLNAKETSLPFELD